MGAWTVCVACLGLMSPCPLFLFSFLNLSLPSPSPCGPPLLLHVHVCVCLADLSTRSLPLFPSRRLSFFVCLGLSISRVFLPPRLRSAPSSSLLVASPFPLPTSHLPPPSLFHVFCAHIVRFFFGLASAWERPFSPLPPPPSSVSLFLDLCAAVHQAWVACVSVCACATKDLASRTHVYALEGRGLCMSTHTSFNLGSCAAFTRSPHWLSLFLLLLLFFFFVCTSVW